MLKTNIGTIYKTKARRLKDGEYEISLIGIISQKKYQITKYHVTISQEILQSQNSDANSNPQGIKNDKSQQGGVVVAIDPDWVYLLQSIQTMVAHKSQRKEYTLNSRINITDISSRVCHVGNNQDLLETINSGEFSEEDLTEVTCVEPQYVKSALQIIGKEVIEKNLSNEFIALVDAITIALTGLLSPENMNHPYVGIFNIDRGPHVNPAIFLSAAREYFIEEEEYCWMADVGNYQERYTALLEKIFIACKIDSAKITIPNITRGWESEFDKKSIGWRNELARRTILIYEYFFSLNSEEIIQFCNDIVKFYTDLYDFCNKTYVDGGLREKQFLPKKEKLPEIINAYKQSVSKVTVDGNIIKFNSASEPERVCELQIASSNPKIRIARALRWVAASGKIPEPINTLVQAVIKKC